MTSDGGVREALIPSSKGEPVEEGATALTVLTWNVQNAAPERARRQAAWLAAGPGDVAVLTEVPKVDGGRALAQALTQHGFSTHTTSTGDSPTGPGPERDYVVMLAVRRHTLEAVLDDVSCDPLPHRFAAVRIRLARPAGGGTVTVAGVYVPSRGPAARRNVDKRAVQAGITRLLPHLRDLDAPVVLAGDLNVVEPGHVPAHANFGGWEYDFYRSFANHGLIDAYRHLHPSGTDHSWFGRRSGAGYRFDHLFCSAAHAAAVTSCWYDHAPRELALSDHSALVAVVAPR